MMAILHTRRAMLCLMLSLLCILAAGHAWAEPNPVYTVEGVEVDVTATNAVKAREKALDEAQVKAYQLLAERLLGPEELKTFKVPDANSVSLLVQDFEVTNEQLSRVRYKGTYTIRFRPNAMKSQMASQGRTYSDVQKKPVMVLPFFQAQDTAVLWNDGNPWMNAWRNLPTDKSMLQPTVLPLGDAQDVAIIGDDDLMDYDPIRLQEMAGRYSADDAVLLLAIPEAQKLTVNLYKHGFEGPVFVQKVTFDRLPNETDEAIYTRAAMKIKSVLRQDWKNNAPYSPTAPAQQVVQTTVQQHQVAPIVPHHAGPATTYPTYARFASVQDWVRLKNALDRTPGVQAVLVKALKSREAMLDVRFGGNINQLQMSLQNSGIIMRATSANAPIEIYMNSAQQLPYRQ